VLKDIAQSVIAWDSDDLTLAGQFAISPQGMLAYVSAISAAPDRELVSVDRAGRVSPLGAPPKGYRSHVQLSPDGSKVAVSIQTATSVGLFFYDRVRGGLSRIAESLKGELTVAAWSHDDEIAVQVIDAGRISTALVHPDTASSATMLEAPPAFWASSFSPDGRLVGMKDSDLWIYSPRTPEVPALSLPKTEAAETQPMWSPDGQWLAYASTSTGRSEVYVRRVAGPGNAIMVSAIGGSSPAWNPRGHELFYIEPGAEHDRMMVVALGDPGTPAQAARLFALASGLFLGTSILTPYAVTPDGQHFIGIRRLARSTDPVRDIRVVFNWFEEIKDRIR
jgi:hypothetical protein